MPLPRSPGVPIVHTSSFQFVRLARLERKKRQLGPVGRGRHLTGPRSRSFFLNPHCYTGAALRLCFAQVRRWHGVEVAELESDDRPPDHVKLLSIAGNSTLALSRFRVIVARLRFIQLKEAAAANPTRIVHEQGRASQSFATAEAALAVEGGGGGGERGRWHHDAAAGREMELMKSKPRRCSVQQHLRGLNVHQLKCHWWIVHRVPLVDCT